MKRRFLASALAFALSFGIVGGVLPREEAYAAIAFLYDKSKPRTILTTKKVKSIFVGGKQVDLDYSIGGKKKGIKGQWKSSKPKAVKVSKSGKLKAVGNGTAIVSFHFESGGKKTAISCKVVAKTRASAVNVTLPEGFDGTMGTASVAEFKADLVTNPAAIKINPDIKTSYKVFYELFVDRECTIPAPLGRAVIDENGRLRTKQETGMVFLKVFGKLSKKSTSGVVESEPIAINIGAKVNLKDALVKQTSLNTFDLTLEGADKITNLQLKDLQGREVKTTRVLSADGKALRVQAEKNLTDNMIIVVSVGDKTEQILHKFEDQKVSDIELTSEEASLTSFANGKGVAEIGYRLLDQFGTDITTDPRFIGKVYAFWNKNIKAEVSSNRVVIPLAPDQFVGYVGELELTYGGENPFTKVRNLKIGNFSVIKEVKVMGIYKKTRENSYVKAMDATTYLQAGTVVSHYLSNFDSYFLLLRVKDSNGNYYAEEGIGEEKVSISLNSNTGLGLEIPLGKNRIQSVAPIGMNGETYLAYPLKASTLTIGDVTIFVRVQGVNVSDTMISKVGKINGAAANLDLFGEGRVNAETNIGFSLLNEKNERITKYEEVLVSLGFNDYGAGFVYVPNDSKVISSEKSSIFIFKKNATTGEAELYYKPNVLSLPNGFEQYKEEIILFKGSEKEKKVYLTVKK